MMLIGTLAAIANGVIVPLMLIVFANIIDSFVFDRRYCDSK
jgi:hypothetical protein